MRKTTYTIYNTRLDERKTVPAQNYREALKLTGWSSRDGLVIVPWVDHELRQTRLYDQHPNNLAEYNALRVQNKLH